MKLLPELIISEFKEKIVDESYHPADMVDTLKARVTAVSLLNHEAPGLVKRAELFIKKTSVNKEVDLLRLQEFFLRSKPEIRLRSLAGMLMLRDRFWYINYHSLIWIIVKRLCIFMIKLRIIIVILSQSLRFI
ncbi:hypothetical protein [Legionella genomosp. 1]|uniref:hypothetical protein n=1 Tax=Legionella genomosp. 1 TaxID=1093625 RepID=UPI001054857E|nr:hypothetical protein [Legionella genomosp. 1]